MEFAPIAGKEVFITGGAGFIGSTLAGLLLDRGNKVTIFDNFSRDSLSNKPFKGHANLTAVKGDILDPAGLRAAIGSPHLVVHCAAIAGIDTVIKSPIATMRTNMLGSANVLEACGALGRLERALFFSTSEVFGQNAPPSRAPSARPAGPTPSPSSPKSIWPTPTTRNGACRW
jgi:UDP-glucose 4-epimerase